MIILIFDLISSCNFRLFNLYKISPSLVIVFSFLLIYLLVIVSYFFIQ